MKTKTKILLGGVGLIAVGVLFFASQSSLGRAAENVHDLRRQQAEQDIIEGRAKATYDAAQIKRGEAQKVMDDAGVVAQAARDKKTELQSKIDGLVSPTATEAEKTAPEEGKTE